MLKALKSQSVTPHGDLDPCPTYPVMQAPGPRLVLPQLLGTPLHSHKAVVASQLLFSASSPIMVDLNTISSCELQLSHLAMFNDVFYSPKGGACES